MREIRLATSLKAAVLAGLLAGLALGLFHLAFTEPIIDRAITLEKDAPGYQYQPEIVSRGMQKLGLVIGSVVFGAILGAILAGPYALAHRWLPGRGLRYKALLLTALAFWAITLFPLLKYPANPPGVGEEATIVYRQSIYLVFMALSVAGLAIAIAAYHWLGKSLGGRHYRWPTAAGGYVLFALALFFFMPPNPDPMTMPLGLVWQFRWLSLVGLTLAWAILGVLFPYFLGRFLSPARRAVRS